MFALEVLYSFVLNVTLNMDHYKTISQVKYILYVYSEKK